VKHAITSVLVAIFGLLPRSAIALDPHEWDADTTDERAYEQVVRKYADELAWLNYPRVFTDLEQDLKGAKVWSGETSVYPRLLRAMSVLNQRFNGFEMALHDSAQRGTRLDAFLNAWETGGYQFPCTGDECFAADYVVRYAELEQLSDARAEDFLQRVRTVNNLLVDFKSPALKRTTVAIRQAKERWETFVERGRSQYPWEVLLNGPIFKSTIEYPPMAQLVAVHPGIAVEMTTEDLKELRAKEALVIEVMGFIWYRWKDKTRPKAGLHWWGLSGTVSARDDLRPGVGVLVHYGHMVTVGLSWHDDDRDDQWFDQAPYLLAAFDLFQLAQGRVPEKQKQLAQWAASVKALTENR